MQIHPELVGEHELDAPHEIFRARLLAKKNLNRTVLHALPVDLGRIEDLRRLGPIRYFLVAHAVEIAGVLDDVPARCAIAGFFEMQDEIAARLANQLAVELLGSEARRSERAPAPDSFDLFLQGASWVHRGPTRENLARAQACFERALALDPDNVEALVKMSMVDFQHAEFLFSKDRAARLATAEKASIKALRLAPEHALAHLSLGPVLSVTNRVEAGIAECDRAGERRARRAE